MLSACKSSKEYYSWQSDALYPESGEFEEINDEGFYEIPVKENFQTSATRYWDLLHTRLDIAFDMEQEHVLGEAELTLTPYFYTQDDLTLDAKGMIYTL